MSTLRGDTPLWSCLRPPPPAVSFDSMCHSHSTYCISQAPWAALCVAAWPRAHPPFMQSKTAEERRRDRDLEEARKAGTVPAERDAEGNEINPHIPQYMSQAPWYLNAEGPGLQHQRNLKEKKPVAGVSDFIPRGQVVGPAATKFRKGACANCGAMTHKAKDCVERPRKKGAKFTGSGIKADEVVVEMAYDYAGKRDHWAQYDPSDHTLMIQAHEKEMEVRIKQHKQEQMAKLATKEKEREERKAERRHKRRAVAPDGGEGGGEDDGDGDGSDTDDVDTDDEEEGVDGPEGKLAESEQLNVGTKMNANRNGGAKMTVRNLRIREDTAKYLLNLDVNSAYYDPKTHSMRENPLPDSEEHNFVPYNEEKRSGDARQLASLQLYELEANAKGQALHLNADPTTAELMNKIYREKKERLQASKVNRVLDKYGGAEHLERPPDELLFAQTEAYTEYTPSGAVVHGRERAVAKSKYEEDVHAHNHSCVWGSYFDRQSFRWGYADDHATTRNAYGTGEAGKRARMLAAAHQRGAATPHEGALAAGAGAAGAGAAGAGAAGAGAAGADAGAGRQVVPQSAMFGTGEGLADAPLEHDKLQAALKRERERQREDATDERKRKYNSMASTETTAEEMEAYHRAKARSDDPMAAMLAADAEAATDDEA